MPGVMKKKLGELLFQIVPVMIGVYLGFLVSNWSQNKQKRIQSQVLIENIRSEINANEKILKSVVDYHLMLRDSSRFYSNPTASITSSNFFKGTRVMKLTNSAYETGIQTGIINELSLDKIQAINQLYTFQEDYNDFGNLLMASLINKDFTNKEEDMRKIASMLSVTMTDIVIKERELIDYFLLVKEILPE